MGWNSSIWPAGFLEIDVLNKEFLEGIKGVLHSAPQRKRRTEGLRMMNTHGSMMELTERNRRAIRSASVFFSDFSMELMYTRI